MAILIDTSLWIAMYRDRTGKLGSRLKAASGGVEPVFARPIALEILQGCSTDAEWSVTLEHLEGQAYLELTAHTWFEAAHIYFDARRLGKTIRSSMDCIVAQLAIANNCLLLHNDRDFETIASIRPLKQRRLDLDTPAT